jgi:hypothetical protein
MARNLWHIRYINEFETQELPQNSKWFRREYKNTTFLEGQDTSVGIAISYGLDSPGIESRWRRDFPHRSRPALGPTQPPIQ